MHIQTIGVIGAGVMGTGVAQNLAQSGYRVILIDIADTILGQAQQTIINNTRLQGLFNKREGSKSASAIIDRITFSTDYRSLREVDFIIENATEKWEVKQDIYTQIDQLCPEHCVMAANTSAIPITRIASATRRPEKVIGIHFMNPVPLKPTVELICGFHTSEETLEATQRLLTSMGKAWILVNDSPGFVSNRVLMLTVNEAIFLLYEQVSAAEAVDNIFKLCFGHKMGPLEIADLIGLDTILLSLEVLYDSFKDSKYRPCPLLRQLVEAGLHGRKSGRGFYNYHV